MEIESIPFTTLNTISRKLRAHAALTLLYHSSGDERGLDIAASLEREAHDLWRATGMEDRPTFDLACISQED